MPSIFMLADCGMRLPLGVRWWRSIALGCKPMLVGNIDPPTCENKFIVLLDCAAPWKFPELNVLLPEFCAPAVKGLGWDCWNCGGFCCWDCCCWNDLSILAYAWRRCSGVNLWSWDITWGGRGDFNRLGISGIPVVGNAAPTSWSALKGKMRRLFDIVPDGRVHAANAYFATTRVSRLHQTSKHYYSQFSSGLEAQSRPGSCVH